MSHTVKVLLACAFGSLIGATVALQVNHRWWWTGMLAGFAVGYLAYEFKEVIATVSTAYRNTATWQSREGAWRTTFAHLVLSASFTMSAAPILTAATYSQHTNITSRAILVGSITFIVMSIFIIVTLTPLPKDVYSLEEARQDAIRYAWYCSLPYVYLVLPVRFLRNLWKRRQTLGRAVTFPYRFCRECVRLVHSEIRLLCGVDATIGTVVGYYLHNAILGAAVGGLWGILNFEVVSVRVLKLVPRTHSLFR